MPKSIKFLKIGENMRKQTPVNLVFEDEFLSLVSD